MRWILHMNYNISINLACSKWLSNARLSTTFSTDQTRLLQPTQCPKTCRARINKRPNQRPSGLGAAEASSYFLNDFTSNSSWDIHTMSCIDLIDSNQHHAATIPDRPGWWNAGQKCVLLEVFHTFYQRAVKVWHSTSDVNSLSKAITSWLCCIE